MKSIKILKNQLLHVFFFCILSWPIVSLADTKTTVLSDGEIIGIYNQVNSFDIETALLAMTQAHSKKVKKLAAMVSNDHRGVRLKAAELAAKINAEVILPAARQDATLSFYQTIEELSIARGETFDRAYLLNEIQFHTNAMAAVKNTLLPATGSEALIEHFQTVLPHFEHHLAETVKLAKELGYYKD
ncbi:MAG: DUF4142 domain-containing protein [Methylococcaceae bacterium]